MKSISAIFLAILMAPAANGGFSIGTAGGLKKAGSKLDGKVNAQQEAEAAAAYTPTVPTDLGAVAVSSSQINLNWSPSAVTVGLVTYRIYRNAITTPVATSTYTFYSDTSLTAWTAYSYTVSACDASGNYCSARSVLAATTTLSVPPTISSLIANPVIISPGGTSTITCTAADPNGYALTYAWSVATGTIHGAGAQITWMAMGISTGIVSVTVSNGHGGTAHGSVEVFVVGNFQWVTIPGGSFMMGGAGGCSSNAQPQHQVMIQSFQMAKTLVTNGQYHACVQAGACTAPDYAGGNFMGADQPVIMVDWNQAKTFSEWVGGRLPSEAEWEYAARSGGKEQKYPWGDEDVTCSLAVIEGCGNATAPVCSKPAGNTQQGLCDIAGNVWEWVQDWYHESYDGAPTDGSAWEIDAWESPTGPLRVIRGDSWDGAACDAQSTSRGADAPGERLSQLGFRPAR